MFNINKIVQRTNKLRYCYLVNTFSRNFSKLRYREECSLKTKILNLNFVLPKKFHVSAQACTKFFIDAENLYAYGILPELSAVQASLGPPKQVISIKDFTDFLNQDWRASNASAIVEAFETVKNVCCCHEINLSDVRFDKLVDGLMDHCEHLTDDELLKLLLTLTEYPSCDTITAHNFHDVWSCLDDICCWKMSGWDFEKKFVFANAWYKLHLVRLSDYIFEVLDRVPAKAHKLSKTMLLYSFFYINMCRKRGVPFELEHALAKNVEQFTADELAVIAMGFFKTRTRVKVKTSLSHMISTVLRNCDTIHEISLTAILKAIRLTQQLDSADEVTEMLDKLVGQVPRLSNLSIVHLALVGTGLQLKHILTLQQCTEKICSGIETARLKDIERILLVTTMFNFDTNPSFHEAAFAELHKYGRRKEFVQYNRCLPCALNYLSMRNMYSYKLMDEVLNEDYILEVYGKSARELPRELLVLDTSIDIECPDYRGNRLSLRKKYQASKWLTEYAPTHDQTKRFSLSDKLYLDVVKHVTAVVGDERFVRSDHVLPHFSKSDIIVCKEKKTGRFVEPFGFENYILGDVKRPLCTEDYEWFAFVVLIPNLTVRNHNEPLGAMVMKARQLAAVGYTPIFVFWNAFCDWSDGEKTKFISWKLR